MYTGPLGFLALGLAEDVALGLLLENPSGRLSTLGTALGHRFTWLPPRLFHRLSQSSHIPTTRVSFQKKNMSNLNMVQAQPKPSIADFSRKIQKTFILDFRNISHRKNLKVSKTFNFCQSERVNTKIWVSLNSKFGYIRRILPK